MALRPLFRPVHSLPRLLARRVSSATPFSTSSAASTSPSASSVSPEELSHFASLASSWWDPVGPSRILHLMNPLRHQFISSCLTSHPPVTAASADGLRYLDIGCGGGIFAESLARTIPAQTQASAAESELSTSSSPETRVAAVTAIDPSPVMIRIATQHARTDPLVWSHLQSGRFNYRNTSLEQLVAEAEVQPVSEAVPSAIEKNAQFDVITLFEVLEHVDPTGSAPASARHTLANPQSVFLHTALHLLRPGGWLVGSTIARSLNSWVIHSLLAEAPWPIGVVPRGTHDWHKFVNPNELREWMARGGVADAEGIRFVGAVYVPGFGWRFVGSEGAEGLGNYFFAVRKSV